jgi:transcriptional regulator with XRE-family HTH domain
MDAVELQRYLVGEDLVALRRKIGWSQQALAQYLGLPDASHLRDIENGHRWITCAEEVLLQHLEESFSKGELRSELDALGFRVDSETVSTGGIRQEIEDLLGAPDMQRLHETSTSGIYVTFSQKVNNAFVDQVTLGPYLDVELSEGAMHVTAPEAGANPLRKSFCLASLQDAGWIVHPEVQKAAAVYALVRFHTFRHGGKRCRSTRLVPASRERRRKDEPLTVE